MCYSSSKLLPESTAQDWYQAFCITASDFQLARHLSSPGSKFKLAIDTILCHWTQQKWHQSIALASEI